FETVHDLILYDYAIHWFDMVHCLLGSQPARRVYASAISAANQPIAPPLLGQALIEYDAAHASLAFDAAMPYGAQDRSFVAGSDGSISSVGMGNRDQQLTLTTAQGICSPELTGCWFPDGFHGT